MYNNSYIPNYNPNFSQQNLNEKIDNEIAKLQQMKSNMNQQTPAINQTFQLAPTNNHTIRYANTIDEVNKETIFYDTPFFSKDMSVVWIKNAKGEIRTYELNEIIPKDDKDIQIEMLQAQIDELKKGIKENEQYYSNVITEQDATDTSTIDRATREEFESNKPTGISKISRSKKK